MEVVATTRDMGVSSGSPLSDFPSIRQGAVLIHPTQLRGARHHAMPAPTALHSLARVDDTAHGACTEAVPAP